MVEELSDKRLIVVTGKGGVGKTTLSAALALRSAREGKRTLVCEVNTKERVSQLLGKPPVGAEVTLLEENLWAVDIRPQEAMREYALMILKFEGLYNAVFENKVMHYFLRFVPSLQELVLLGKILFHLKEKRSDGTFRFEKIIVDSPATGHAITFYSVPQVIIDTVPPGTMANEATWMRDFVVDPAVTAVVLVSLPEELPVNETLELCATLRESVHMQPRLVVLNAFIEPRFSSAELEALPSPLKGSMEAYTARAAQSQASRERLLTLGLPVLTVPPLYGEPFGRAAIEKIALQLGPLARPPSVAPVTP